MSITATQVDRINKYIFAILPSAGMKAPVDDKIRQFALLQAGIKDLSELTEQQMGELLDFFDAQEPKYLVDYIERSLNPEARTELEVKPTQTPATAETLAAIGNASISAGVTRAETPFKQRVMTVVSRGVSVTPVLPGQKRAVLPKWQESATVDLKQIDEWAQQYPNHNYGCVAKGQTGGFWFLEIDAAEVFDRILAETKHDLTNEVSTFMVRSRKGRGHFYFRQNAKSIAMGNISQAEVKYGDWSARVHNEYVVGPGSRRDDTGTTYDIVNDAEIIEAPHWLVEWCISQKAKQKSPVIENGQRRLLRHGQLHGAYVAEAGRLWNRGYEREDVVEMTVRWTVANSADAVDEKKVAKEALNVTQIYPRGSAPETFQLELNQKPDLSVIAQEEFAVIPYPTFPRWVMEGTSIYENLVKPICDQNSRYPEFMWVPAMALLLNYLGGKVKVEMRTDRSGIFLVLIGTKGQTIKSSSVEDVMTYFQHMGCLAHANRDLTAQGRSLVWTAGSTEGLGLEMQKTGCKNAVLFFDEFKLLTDKACIESSSMKSHLLSLYEQGKFQNSVKDKSKQFSLEPNSYTATLIACTTPKNFHDLWSTFGYGAEGMDDRFFFLLEPQELRELTPQVVVDTTIGAQNTRRLLDKAISRQTLRMAVDAAQLVKDSMKSLGNRPSQRAEKWARAIAVDMGLEEIKVDAVRRGIALTEYEHATKKYLDVRGANSKLAAAQLKLCQILQRQPRGCMPLYGKKGLYAAMRGDSYDTKMWHAIYGGLVSANRIGEIGDDTKGNPRMVVLLRALAEED